MKTKIIRIIISAVLFAAGLIIKPEAEWITLVIFIASFGVVGYDVVFEAVANLFKGHILDENLLMSIAATGAFFIKSYPEAAAVMLLYQIGEVFQSYAVGRSRRSISKLMDIRPDFAAVLREGSPKRVPPEQVECGEIIEVSPGERVPLDGIVTEGSSFLDTAALTGESVPRRADAGDEVLSGSVNLSGVIYIKVQKEYAESTVARILELVENAADKKSRSEKFITRFSAVYTPVVVGLAAALAVIPPLFIPGQVFSEWIYRALSFLVVSCPCALVISVPLSFFGGIGGASRAGILIKGSGFLEALSKTDTVVFDKTGTLTKGVFEVQSVRVCGGMDRDELLRLAAHAECFSSHPIASSLKRAYGKEPDKSIVKDVQETAGKGIGARVDGKAVLAGNAKLMESMGIDYVKENAAGTVIYVAADRVFSGSIVISDSVKEDAAEAVSQLRAEHVRKTVMLTGDSAGAAQAVCSELGIDEVHAELLPGGKVDVLEKLMEQSRGTLAYAGDGINDAPVLARADIGIAMGGMGSDAAIEAADVVIMTDEPSKIAQAIRISRRTLMIVKQNIVFALGVKAVVLIFSALGASTMWEAIFADVGVSMLAVLNALRALRVKK